METTPIHLVVHDKWARDVAIAVFGWLAIIFVVTILLLLSSGML